MVNLVETYHRDTSTAGRVGVAIIFAGAVIVLLTIFNMTAREHALDRLVHDEAVCEDGLVPLITKRLPLEYECMVPFTSPAHQSLKDRPTKGRVTVNEK